MTKIMPLQHQYQPTQNLTPEERRKKQEQVATGVGGAAGLTTSATSMAGKRGLKGQALKQGEQTLQHMMQSVQTTAQTANKNAKTAKGLWTTFKANVKLYSNDIMNRMNTLKDTKFIGKIINSPISKKFAGLTGGALAFFVLITGVNKAVKTGALAIDDFKSQYNEFRTAA